MISRKRLVIIGGGASGFFCAVNAAENIPGIEIIILEKTQHVLSKVRVSGGGRCNVTHACFENAELIRRYPRGEKFLRKAFNQFSSSDTVQWFLDHGVSLKTEEDGRMFPVTNTSKTIIDCLNAVAHKHGVAIWLQREVIGLEKKEGKWDVRYKDNSVAPVSEKVISADFVCVATGGFPKASQFEWIHATGHTIIPPVPSLFTFNLPDHPIRELMGVSVDPVQVKITGTKFVENGPVLITHWGLSGPVVLRLSAWAARELAEKEYHFRLHISWLPSLNDESWKLFIQRMRRDYGRQFCSNKNPFQLPQRLWIFLLSRSSIAEDKRWADLNSQQQNQLMLSLLHFEVEVKGKTTFKEEFVTAGGVSTKEVDPVTFQSRLHPHLYFTGEVLDIDGITGGFNFQHAWTSGWSVAQAIANICK